MDHVLGKAECPDMADAWRKDGGKNRMKKADRLLIMIAACGELPASAAVWITGSPSYTAALITRLKKERKIGIKSAGHLKGYVLYQNGRDHLLRKYPEIWAGCLETGGNYTKGETEKRLRMHRMGQALCFLYSQGIAVLGEYTSCLTGENNRSGIVSERYIPSLKLKRYLAKEAGGSRACGVWVTEKAAFSVYNTMDSLMRWSARTEWCFRMRAEQYLDSIGAESSGENGRQNIQAAILGKGMAVGLKLLGSDGGMKKQLFRLDDVYDCYYFLPMQPEAGLQLTLIKSRKKQMQLEKAVKLLLGVDESHDFICSGRDKSGCSVYFSWLFELWQTRRIAERIARTGGGKVICLDYQAAALKEYLGCSAEVVGLNSGKIQKLLKEK